MADELRAAVIGAGGFIGAIHVRAARLSGARLVAVGESTPERSAQAALTLGAERSITSPEDLAADDIDVVHICTPTMLHERYARVALEAGKHVICEKPLAAEAVVADSLATLAQSDGAVTAIPFVYRFHPLVREARHRVQSGLTGDLRLIHGSYLQDWLSRPTDWSWRIDPKAGGPSRAFADIGSHWFDLIEFVTGHRVARLAAQFGIAFPERLATDHTKAFSTSEGNGVPTPVVTEDTATVMFETDGGAHGTAVISQVSAGRKNRLWFEIDGSKEALVFDQEQAERLWVGRRENSLDVVRDPAVLSPDAARLSVLPAGHAQGWNDCFALFVADVYQAIRGDKPDGLPTFADGARSARLVDAAIDSATKRQWVEVPK